MAPLRSKPAVLLLSIVTQLASVAAQIPLSRKYVGQDFVKGFYFYTDPDLSGGIVTYVDQGKAESDGLVSWTDTQFTMRADDKRIANLQAGRDSVRLVSRDEFGDGVYIFDVEHIPLGCGTWPAAWTTTTKNWPYAGEIDVIEGANGLSPNSQTTVGKRSADFRRATPNIFSHLRRQDDTVGDDPSTPATGSDPEGQNVVSLHASPNCPLSYNPSASNASLSDDFSGRVVSTDCSGLSSGNVGCGVEVPGKSWGHAFNEAGGGVYAMYRDLANTSSIHTWFWERGSDIPADVRDVNSQNVNPSQWGKPVASFEINEGCASQFFSHVIVLNINFCGGFATATYSASGCPGECEVFVRYEPKAFTETFFTFNSVRVYTNGGLARIGMSILHNGLAVILMTLVAMMLL